MQNSFTKTNILKNWKKQRNTILYYIIINISKYKMNDIYEDDPNANYNTNIPINESKDF